MDTITEARVAARPAVAPDLTIRRVFEAPIAQVFRAWTDPLHVAAWWGPHGFSNRVALLEPRPGGRIRIDMDGPGGRRHAISGHFVDVEAPTRIAFVVTVRSGDEVGGVESVHAIALSDRGARTGMTLHCQPSSPIPASVDIQEAWTQSLERLAAILRAI